MGEQIALKVKRKEIEPKPENIHHVRIEIVKYPVNADLKKYEDWAVSVAKNFCTIIDFKANYHAMDPRFDVKFVRGSFFDTFTSLHSH